MGLALATACSASPTARKDLSECVQDFSEALRWKHLPVAMQYLGADGRDVYALALQKAYRKAEVLDFEILALSVQPDGKSAIATVLFAFMAPNETTVRQGIELQHWSLRDGRWVLLQQVGPEEPGSTPSPFAAPSETKD